MRENIKKAITILEWIEINNLNVDDILVPKCQCEACIAYQIGGIEKYIEAINKARDWNVSINDIERAKKIILLK